VQAEDIRAPALRHQGSRNDGKKGLQGAGHLCYQNGEPMLARSTGSGGNVMPQGLFFSAFSVSRNEFNTEGTEPLCALCVELLKAQRTQRNSRVATVRRSSLPFKRLGRASRGGGARRARYCTSA